MFQFRRFPTYTYLIQCTLTEYCSAGFPHSEILGSMLMCSSPRLIAACHVLHRLLMPRHSPCALISLTSSTHTPYPLLPPFGKSSLISSRLLSKNKTAFAPFCFRSRSLVLYQELCRPQILVHCSFCYPNLWLKSTKICTLLPLLLLARNFLLCFHCSVFKVQILFFFKTRLKCSIDWQNTSIQTQNLV